jgi:branched-chain amino acid transport system permease protein
MTTSFFLQTLLNGLQLASVYILIALGFTLIFGILHIVNMAQGSIYMLGGYGIWLTFAVLGLNYFLSLIITVAAVGCVGLVLERIIFRRLLGLVMPTVVVSLALMQVLEQSVMIGFGIKEKTVPSPFPGVLNFLGTVFPTQRLAILLIAVVLTAALVWWVHKSKVGLALRAVALDRETASMYGISHTRYGALACGLGFGLAGAAGALIAPLFYVDSQMGAQPLLKMFTVIVIGGLGSIPGAIIAGLLLGLVDSFVATFFSSVAAGIVGFSMILVVLLVKPTGFFGNE